MLFLFPRVTFLPSCGACFQLTLASVLLKHCLSPSPTWQPLPSSSQTVNVPAPWLHLLKVSAASCEYTGPVLPRPVPSCSAHANGATIDAQTQRSLVRAQSLGQESPAGSQSHRHAAAPLRLLSPRYNLPRPLPTQVLKHLIRSFLILNCPFVPRCLSELLIDDLLGLTAGALSPAARPSGLPPPPTARLGHSLSAGAAFPCLSIRFALALPTHLVLQALPGSPGLWPHCQYRPSSQINLMTSQLALTVYKSFCNLCHRYKNE